MIGIEVLIAGSGSDTLVLSDEPVSLVEIDLGGGGNRIDASWVSSGIDLRAAADPAWRILASVSFGGTRITNVSEIIGSAHTDTIYAFDGGNTIRAGAGEDIVAGGIGSDVIHGGSATGDDPEIDTLTYADSLVAVTFTTSTATRAMPTGGTETDQYSEIEKIVGSGLGDTFRITSPGGAVEQVMLGNGIDTVTIETGGMVFLGGEGTEVDFVLGSVEKIAGTSLSTHLVLRSLDQAVTISDAGGDDEFDGRDSGAALTIDAGAGKDVLCGGSGNDVIRGGVGNDIIRGGSGTNTLYGDAGYDTFYLESGQSNTVYGGEEGSNIVRFEDDTSILLSIGGSRAIAGSNTFYQIGSYYLGGASDTIYYDRNPNLSGTSPVTVNGGRGDDKFSVGASTQTVTFKGDEGADTISFNGVPANSGYQYGYGGSGNDVLTGGAKAHSILYGDDDNDTFYIRHYNRAYGGSGDDTFFMNGTGCQVWGNAGADTFIVQGGALKYLYDFSVGEDTLKIEDYQLLRNSNGTFAEPVYESGDTLFRTNVNGSGLRVFDIHLTLSDITII